MDETIVGTDGKQRCFGNGPGKEFYAKYHDEEWGEPLYDDQKLFEMLSLEGAQAGLSWETVLKKRAGYRKAFHRFNIKKCANMTDKELEALTKDESIIRNRLKIFSVRKNAKVVLEIQKEFGSLSDYLWAYVDHEPQINRPQSHTEVPASTPMSDQISKDLKKRGMSFVGSTIVYAYMQAIGMVNDCWKGCWKYPM